MSFAGQGEKILIVDDAAATLEILERNLSGAGYQTLCAASADEALRLLSQVSVDLIITDLKMPGASGLDLVRHVRENLPDAEVTMITGYASVEGAVQAVKLGAEDYLAKPFTEDELLRSVGAALEKLRMRRAARVGGAPPRSVYGLLGDSDAMKEVLRAIAKAASTSATVLISGESGTGKELVARAIHYSSARAAAPFVAVNCGAIPENLLESELFGHIKGAFTGAVDSRAGFFQTADGGTIFLDEISETSPAMQVKLLRVLQNREICMVGTTRPRKVDVRIIAATNRDPLSLVEKGILREDLFYRLHVVAIRVAPLRDRKDDVLPLVRSFAGKFAEDLGKRVPEFSDSALRALTEYYWPGNVRELENLVQRLVLMCEGDRIEVFDLPSLMRYSLLREVGYDRTLAEVEVEYVKGVLASVAGNRSKAAKILGIDRKTLREKLKVHPERETEDSP